VGGLHGDAHGGEHDGELAAAVVLSVAVGLVAQQVAVGGGALLDQPRLATNLGRNVVVGQPRSREQRDLLPTRNRVHDVDGGHTRLNHVRDLT